MNWTLQEQPFTSQTPVIGGLIARFRALWNSISTQWYVRPLLHQQNQINQHIATYLHDLDVRLIAQDREQTQLSHDSAEMTAQLVQMNRLLQSIDERLARLEAR